MGVPIEIVLPGQTHVDALALPLAQPLDDLAGDGARIVDEKLGGRLRQLAASGEFRGERGEALVVLEAMKMETPLVSPYDATVRAVHVAEGDRVAGGALLVELDD